MRAWTARQWVVAAVVAVLTGTVIGTVTALVPNPLFTRMIEAPWWSYPVWMATAVSTGLLAASYVTPAGERQETADRSGRSSSRSGLAGAVLSFFAVGCPVCNKLVVLALGTSGAVAWFEPVQPVLALASLGLIGYALRARLRAARSCPVPAPPVQQDDARIGS